MITISQVIDTRPLSWLQIRTMILCSLVVFVDGYDLQTMGLVLTSIAKEWSIPPGELNYAAVALLVGIGIGSAFISPLGDRFGRRPLIVVGLLVIGCTSLCTIYSSNTHELIFWRCLTGAGIGVCQSNATALTAEFSPLSRRATLMTLMGCFIPFGAMVAGMTADALMHSGGWRMLFKVGGSIPLILAVGVALAASESIRLLFARFKGAANDARIVKILRRMAPDIDSTTITADPLERSHSASLREFLQPPYRERTVRLWGLFAFTSLLLYTLVTWLPALLAGAGWAKPSLGMMTMQLGGIFGSLILAWAVDRRHTIAALACGYSLTGIAALLFMVLPAQGPSWYVLAASMGVGISGGMLALSALGAIFYPPVMRATGFGWAAAAGRIGAVAGPLVVGWVLAAGVPSNQIIAWLAIPASLCVLIVLSMRGALQRAQDGEIKN